MQTNNITIHLCDYNNHDDRNAVATLINAYIDDEMGGGTPLDCSQQQQLLEALQQHPKSIVILAVLQGVRCGMLVAFENFSTFSVRPMINIHDIIVLKAYRGKRVGKRLMESVIELAKNRLCSRITLEVREDNIAARHLYQSLGFAATSPIMDYWRKYLV
ncbi:MAG: GNAT family N-acetyltransferase [Dysgonamonadaceae bacterium]|jgi:ribosomal protein S18 acetylase RimI-like enzyme|nr:GNAT family N-acetyltransferase [Dysgonamonadaceae bacterium]